MIFAVISNSHTFPYILNPPTPPPSLGRLCSVTRGSDGLKVKLLYLSLCIKTQQLVDVKDKVTLVENSIKLKKKETGKKISSSNV